MNHKKKKLNLGLTHFYPAAKYAGALFTALAFPHLSSRTWLIGNVFASRFLLFLWTPVLLFLGLWLDRTRAAMKKKDAEEIKAGLKYGGMNESTLLALSIPPLFILDGLSIIHVLLSYLRSGSSSPVSAAASLLPAAGMVLFIYGRALPQIPYLSVWGVMTKASRESEENWRKAHQAASLPVTILGITALLLSAVLTGRAAIAACAVLCAAAFAVMFYPVRK